MTSVFDLIRKVQTEKSNFNGDEQPLLMAIDELIEKDKPSLNLIMYYFDYQRLFMATNNPRFLDYVSMTPHYTTFLLSVEYGKWMTEEQKKIFDDWVLSKFTQVEKGVLTPTI